MPRYIGGKVLLARLWLALPLLAGPALCFTVNRASFVWSIIVLTLTGWKLLRSGNHATAPEASAKAALSKPWRSTLLLQMLAFVWMGAVWLLEWLGQVLTQSSGTSRIVRWMEAQWFADAAAWLILFAVVCGLFRLTRPIFAWHQRAVQNAARFLRREDISNAS